MSKEWIVCDCMWRAEPTWLVIQVVESLSVDMVASQVNANVVAFDAVQPQCQTSAPMVRGVVII